MKLTHIEMKISKAVQVKQFEPLNVEVKMKCDIEKDDKLKDIFDEIRDSLIEEVDYTIIKYLEED